MPPGERPPPPAAPQAALYAARLQKLDEDRRAQRAQQRKDTHAWETGRAAREQEHQRQLQGVWGPALLSRPECQAELATHADRVARINRIIDIAEDQHNTTLLAHAKTVLNKEIARNARAMAELGARLGVQ